MALRRRGKRIILFLSVLVLVGCAQEAAKKPDITTASATSTPSSKAPAAKSAESSRQTPSGSSLDAHREGKAPSSGPLVEIYFEFDSYDLRADARRTLQTHAAWLKSNPAARVEIEGHCDERGTTEYNLALGAKRARSARDYLVSLGIAAARISTTGYGEELPVCKEKTEECFRKNRRDRFVVVGSRPAS